MHNLIVGGWVGSKSLHPIPKIIRTLVVTDDPLSHCNKSFSVTNPSPEMQRNALQSA
jgi:hypothetical protein